MLLYFSLGISTIITEDLEEAHVARGDQGQVSGKRQDTIGSVKITVKLFLRKK